MLIKNNFCIKKKKKKYGNYSPFVTNIIVAQAEESEREKRREQKED